MPETTTTDQGVAVIESVLTELRNAGQVILHATTSEEASDAYFAVRHLFSGQDDADVRTEAGAVINAYGAWLAEHKTPEVPLVILTGVG